MNYLIDLIEINIYKKKYLTYLNMNYKFYQFSFFIYLNYFSVLYFYYYYWIVLLKN